MKTVMKTINYIYILVSLAVILLLTGCEGFLDQEPVLSQTNELTLSSFKGLNSATAAAYSNLYSTTWYGRDFVVISELRSGNAKKGPKDSGRFNNPYTWNFNRSSTATMWAPAYNCISRANNVINVINDGFSEKDITKQQLNNIKAECLFLRAISHFDLVRVYAQPYSQDKKSLGVPVTLVTENGSPKRNTVEEVYAQVEKDLLEAEKLMSDSYVRAGVKDEAATVTKSAIQALLSRVYLYMENWQKAANYATKVINSNKYKMWTADKFTTYEKDGVWGVEKANEGGEVIFEVYGSEANSAHGNWNNITYITNANATYADVAMSNDLYSLYEATDVRGQLVTTLPDFVGSIWSNKYPGKNGNLREDNIPVLRLSEMYLNRAEAIFNGASVSGVTAASDVNMVTSNRGASPVLATPQTIFNERRKELAFEGHITFDYARTKHSLTRTDYTGSTNKDVPFPSYKWALPIPMSEIDANPNIEQNPKY